MLSGPWAVPGGRKGRLTNIARPGGTSGTRVKSPGSRFPPNTTMGPADGPRRGRRRSQSANSSGPRPRRVPNQRARLSRRAWCAGAAAERWAKRRQHPARQCLPGWNQRLLVCRAARRFPSRRTRAVGRLDRIGASPEGVASRSRPLPPPDGPLSRDDPVGPPDRRFCQSASAGRDGVPTAHRDGSLSPSPTQPAPRQSAPGSNRVIAESIPITFPGSAKRLRSALRKNTAAGARGQRFSVR